MTPRERALLSLQGLTVGDALGQCCFSSLRTRMHRQMPPMPWQWTDDSEMAYSIVATLLLHQTIDQDALAASFVEHFHETLGYGPAMLFKLFPALQAGQYWQIASKELFQGTGSFGNGSAMRVAPLGGYFADDLARVVTEAIRSAEVTHAHPEALAGAIAVAVAAALAWQLRGSTTIPGSFINQVLPLVPASTVREGLERALHLSPDSSLETAVYELGAGERITCMDTVPFCLWNASRFLDDYPEAIWSTVKAGGDIDTNAAIVGGIVALSAEEHRVPSTWISNREPWPLWFEEITRKTG
jgi:ADP-ribosylglycohydrolase